jgi:hypothetical protein
MKEDAPRHLMVPAQDRRATKAYQDIDYGAERGIDDSEEVITVPMSLKGVEQLTGRSEATEPDPGSKFEEVRDGIGIASQTGQKGRGGRVEGQAKVIVVASEMLD